MHFAGLLMFYNCDEIDIVITSMFIHVCTTYLVQPCGLESRRSSTNDLDLNAICGNNISLLYPVSIEKYHYLPVDVPGKFMKIECVAVHTSH